MSYIVTIALQNLPYDPYKLLGIRCTAILGLLARSIAFTKEYLDESRLEGIDRNGIRRVHRIDDVAD